MARLVRTFPRPETRLTWLQLGLVMGAVAGLYDLVQQVLKALLPIFPQSYDFKANLPVDLSFISTILLVGTVGLIGEYSSGRIRVGIFAGLLTSVITYVISNGGQALSDRAVMARASAWHVAFATGIGLSGHAQEWAPIVNTVELYELRDA